MSNLNELKPIINLNPFAKFCCTIGNLPTSYMASLTYEEQLMWFCDYLQNTVIPAVNTNAEAVKELQELYVKLKNYVDNYFNNLDVQNEINNKLDEMAEDGTLQEIISAYLNSKAIFGFDNVESMKNSTNLIDGSYAQTFGFYSYNDGGNALYKIRNITNDDVVDNIFIIPLQNPSLIAELIIDIPKKFNVLKLGLKRNIQESQNALLASIIDKLTNGDTLFFPSGEYYFNEKIELKNRIGIEGEILSTGERDKNFNGSRLNFDILTTPESNYTLLDCTQNNKTSIKNIYVSSNSFNLSCNRTLQSTDTTKVDTFTQSINTPNIEGIRLASYGSEVQNVIIRGCSKRGIFIGKYNLLENVRIYECNYGFALENDNTLNNCNCFTCNVAMAIEGSINLINNFRADEVKRGIWCYAGNNNINNFNIDYALFNAIQLENSDNNFISGNIGRVGTYYAEKGNNSPLESCYAGLIGSNFNTIIINVSKRNTKDSLPEILNPCYSIVTRNTCKGNVYDLTGVPKFLEFTKEKLTVNQLKNLLTIEYGTNSDTIKYYDFIYSFNETTNAYNNNSIKCSHHLIKYSDGEIFNKSLNALNNTFISFEMANANNHSFLILITKNRSSNRGLYLLGYSKATDTLISTPIVALDGITISKNDNIIKIDGVTEYSSAQIISNTDFITY